MCGLDARVLVLGSLPSEVSLARGEYYAQPRNAFWPMMGELFDFSPALSYAERIAILKARRIALWDVCSAAERVGSLDSAIAKPLANDFGSFLRTHAQLRLIAFNGLKSADLYRRLVERKLSAAQLEIPRQLLPSTSSALASMAYSRKLDSWRVVGEVART
jgi:TDG/mug DNA glycosylase family protein